jgi:phage/plasmid-associated DNA primase
MTTDTVTYTLELNKYEPVTVDANSYEQICQTGNAYEIIPDDKPVKLYFDVDMKKHLTDGDIWTDEDGDDLLAEMPRLRAGIFNILSEFFADKYDYSQISISTSHKAYFKPYDTTTRNLKPYHIGKLSFHIVMNNLTALKSHQAVIVQQLNAYANQYADSEDLNTYFTNREMFDTAVYKKTQKLRSPNSSKPLENRPLKIERGTFAMSCVSAFIPEDAYNIVVDIPEKPMRTGDNGALRAPENVEKNKYIFTEGLPLLSPYAQKGTYHDCIQLIWAIKNVFGIHTMAHDFAKLGKKTNAYDPLWVDETIQNARTYGSLLGMGTIISYMRKTDGIKTNDILTNADRMFDLAEARQFIIETIIPEQPVTVSEATEYIPTTTKSYDELYAEQQVKTQLEYIQSRDAKKFVSAFSVSDYDFAMLFIKVFGGLFITCNDISYYYTGYVWKTCDKKRTDLHKFLAREFYMFVGKLYAYWVKQAHEELAKTTDEEKQKGIQANIDNMLKAQSAMYIRLTGHDRRKTLVDDIVIYSTNNDIEFNKHNHLFAFKNAVFDLRKNEQIIPDPEHYISLYADYEYDPSYSPDKITELNNIIQTIHQNEEIREYYFSVMATGLIGDHLQYFFVFTGVGGNGKGLTNKLFMETISNYGYKMPNTLFTQDIKAGANPEVANMHQKRFCVAQEPKHGSKLRMDNIKEFTGENQLNARQLYSGDTHTNMNNTLVLEANIIPHTNEVGNSVARRLRIIPFLTTAIEKADFDALENKTNYCIKSSEYDTPAFLENYKQAFFEILRPYVVAYYKSGDIPQMPEICRKVTNEHMAISDSMNAWIEDNYVKCENAPPLKLKDVYNHFKTTEAFLSMSKNQKRDFNMAAFTNKLSSSPFIAKYVKRRDERYNKEKLKSDSLIAWKIKRDITDNDEEEKYEMVDV